MARMDRVFHAFLILASVRAKAAADSSTPAPNLEPEGGGA